MHLPVSWPAYADGPRVSQEYVVLVDVPRMAPGLSGGNDKTYAGLTPQPDKGYWASKSTHLHVDLLHSVGTYETIAYSKSNILAHIHHQTFLLMFGTGATTCIDSNGHPVGYTNGVTV